MSLRLIIFDLDGTLIDTKDDITAALNHAVAPLGLPVIMPEDTVRLVGDGVVQLIEKVVDGEDIGLRDRVLKDFSDYYCENISRYSLPYPGVIETLAGLSGYRKAVVTNKRYLMTSLLLRNLGMEGYFDYVLGGDSTPEKKPSPVPVKMAMEHLGAGDDETLMIGDSDNDIAAAIKAGIRCAAVTYGYRPVGALAGADFYIKSDMRELFDIIEMFHLN